MPEGRVGAVNADLQKDQPNKKGREEIADDLVPQITHISDVMRVKNNIYTSKRYRIDVRVLKDNAAGGAVAGDFKVDVQTKGKKSDSRTVAVVFVAAGATNASLNDLHSAIVGSLADGFAHRVT